MYESIWGMLFVWHFGLQCPLLFCFILFKYLMSTNFPLKPFQSYSIIYTAATFRELLFFPYVHQHTTSEKQVGYLQLRHTHNTISKRKKIPLQLWLFVQVVFCFCCCFFLSELSCVLLFCDCLCAHQLNYVAFNAIPYHHRTTNLSKIQFNSVNEKVPFFHLPISTMSAVNYKECHKTSAWTHASFLSLSRSVSVFFELQLLLTQSLAICVSCVPFNLASNIFIIEICVPNVFRFSSIK